MLFLVVLAALLASPMLGWAGEFDEAALNKLLPEVARYEAGQSRQPLIAAQKLVAEAGKDPKQAAAAARLVASLLEEPKATRLAKDFACRQLWIVGTAEQVPALARLLDDAQLSHMARYAMERMDAPAVDKALREALGRVRDDELLIGVITSIGERQDAGAVAPLANSLGHKNPAVAAAAGAALGKIGGAQAAEAIGTARKKADGRVRSVLTEAWLRTAEGLLAAGKKAEAAEIYKALYAADEPQHVRVAALGGRLETLPPDQAGKLLVDLIQGEDPQMRIVAVRHLRHVQGEGITGQVAALLTKAEPSLQALLVGVLAERGDAAARPAVERLAREAKNDETRLAAVKALAKLGDASTVPLLAKLAAASKGALQAAARHSLARLRGEGVNDAILQTLKGAEEATRVELMRSLRTRRAEGKVPAILTVAAEDPSAAVRRECFSALAELASAEHLGRLAELLLKEGDAGARGSAERAVLAVARRAEAPAAAVTPILAAHGKAAGAARTATLRLLSRLGGKVALKAVTDDLAHQSADVRAGAIRALSNWPDASAVEPLRAVAKDTEDKTHRILALRGFIRCLGLSSDRSAKEAVALYKDAIELATRPEEKKLALAGLAKVAHPEALKLAEGLAKTPALKAEAQQAAQAIRKALADK
jgi:HEAT repeat protein